MDSRQKKSHPITNKSHFISLKGKRNLTIDFGSITFHMKLTHFCSYIFITLVFLHRNAEIIIHSQNMWGWTRPLAISSTSHDLLKRREKLFWHLSTDNTPQKLKLNLICEITILLIQFLLQCALPVAVWFHIEISGSDWNPSGKLTTLPGSRSLSWKLFLMHLKMKET